MTGPTSGAPSGLGEQDRRWGVAGARRRPVCAQPAPSAARREGREHPVPERAMRMRQSPPSPLVGRDYNIKRRGGIPSAWPRAVVWAGRRAGPGRG
ncbi:MAG: hypothetical protein MZV63_56485 [Marinilabiliales bacterium]|nr:hypothetical protein [Marinilabiliales bacterium]